MSSRSELNTSSSPIWDSSDPQRRPPPLPMREEFTLNHVEGGGKLTRTSSISSHLYKQLGPKTSSQMLRISTDDKTADIVHSISETTNTILGDLRSLIERSKDNASTLLDLKQSIIDAKRGQKIIDEIQAIITSNLPPQDNDKDETCDIFKEKLDQILKILNTNTSFHNTETQLLTDINKKLEAIEAFQGKLFSQKLEINNLISSYETLQQTNITEIESMYSRKVEMSAELARLDAHIGHKKDSLDQMEERVKILENRLEDIQLRLNKQREENKKLNKSSKKKVHQSAKSPTTPQNIRHFSLMDIHNRNPSIVTLAPSTIMNSPNNMDSITDKKEKRKTSWSRKVVNAMGFPFQHNNKENSPVFPKNNEELTTMKKKKYPNNFGTKTAKTFRSFSTRA